MASETPVEQVRAAADIIRVVGQHVNLKKAGRTYKALCPFHSEKTPSFVVFPETGRWHCFGCGEGGDVFTFLMKVENLTFPEALRRLADEAGISLPQATKSNVSREERDNLYAANEAAAVYYHALLLKSAGTREYVAQRGITDDTLRRFLLGVAPEGDHALQNHLLQAGFGLDDLLNVGLLYQGEDSPARDRFRGRLMFPIRDARGRIVSFGARALLPGAQPKYLNGPQTEIFDKGATLYGLNAATDAIKREHRSVVVEGYVDVVIAHQAGFENVVATLGTSITDRQVRELARFAPEICLALDADAAGQAAALRGAQVANEAGGGVRLESLLGFERLSITLAVLPDGKDPDEVILERPEAWRAAIDGARAVMEQAVEWARLRYDLSTLEGKRDAAESLVPLLANVADPISRAHYAELVARELHVEARAISERLAALRRPHSRGRRPSPAEDEATPAGGPTAAGQVYAIALLIEAAHRGLSVPNLDPADFSDPDLRALLLLLQDMLATARGDWRPHLLSAVQDNWLERSVDLVRAMLANTERLTDAEVAAEAAYATLELQESRLAVELAELVMLADEADEESAELLKQRIADTLQARVQVATRARQGVSTHVPSIPWKFRSGGELRG